MTFRRIGFLAAIFGIGTWSTAALAGDEAAKKGGAPAGAQGLVGKPAPDFTGTDVDGKTHKLSDLKGKIAVIEWYSAKCPFVQKHVKDKKTMQNTFAKFKDKGVIWLGVDSNVAEIAKPDDIKANIKECAITYPIILDPDGKIGHAFGAKTTPHMFVIDKNGIVAYEGAIDSDASGKEASPINYVEAALQSLVDGSQVATQWSKPYGCSVKYGTPGGETKEKEKEKDKGAGNG
jgi:peroxiredoxin